MDTRGEEIFKPYSPTNPDDPFRLEVARLLSLVDPQAAERYSNCHKEGHGWVEYCPHNPDHYQKFIPCSCMSRICNLCSSYLAGQIRAKYRPIIEALDEKPRPGWSLKLVTLTRSVSLSPDIGKEVLFTLDAARDLFFKLWGKEKGAGGLASLEVGERGQKVHVHLIVYGGFFWKSEIAERAHKSSKYSPIIFAAILAKASAATVAALVSYAFNSVIPDNGKYISETWQALTGDYIVDVQRTSADRAVKEGLKYVTKFVNLSPQQLVDLHMALKGRRHVRNWGCFYGVDLEDQTHEHTDIRACPACNEALEVTTEATFVFILLELDDLKQAEVERRIILDLTKANKLPRPPPAEQLTLAPFATGAVWE